ncbi:MAG TPA: hypothetical protein VN838_20805 [Bradyrhizobium sp.]|nr:hypothetical protein [Bradyrhizobium sp.]
MGARFVISLLTAFAATLSALGGIGWITARLLVDAPREQFLTSYFMFDLAPGWSCEIEETEYVCRPAGAKPYAAIAIIAMKERNNLDRLEDYQAHLQEPRKAVRSGGETVMSEIRYVRRKSLAGKQWVEGLHAGSEIPGYLTYYLATTTSYLGILVTLSVHKDHADKYMRQLNEMMESLTVYQR